MVTANVSKAKYTQCLGKTPCHFIFGYNFAKCWPILIILSLPDIALISSKVVTKYPVTPQTHCYTAPQLSVDFNVILEQAATGFENCCFVMGGVWGGGTGGWPPPQHNKILRLTAKSFTVRISKLLSKKQDMCAMNKCKNA